MKKLIFIFSVILFSGLLFSCSEVPPFIDMTPPVIDTTLIDTTYVNATPSAPQPKKVLLEDFTGVRCPNCPAAQEKAKQIADASPGRVVLMALHVISNFTNPHANSIENYRNLDAEQLFHYLGAAPGLPTGTADRVLFSGESAILVGFNKWESYVQQQLSVTSPVNLNIENTFDDDTRELRIKITAEYTQDVSEKNYLTVALLESHIIDYQLSVTEWIEDYEHNHLLRTYLTPYNGEELNADLQKGRVFVKEFKTVLPAHWKPENVDVAAFVHERASTFKVLQAEEKKVK